MAIRVKPVDTGAALFYGCYTCIRLISYAVKESSGLKRLFIAGCIVVFIAGVAAAVVYYDMDRYAKTAAARKAAPVYIKIDQGDGFHHISDELNHLGIIRHPLKFKLLAMSRGSDKKIQAGEYRLSASMIPIEILDTFVDGKVVQVKFTVPEGFTLAQIADLFERKGFGKAGPFIQKASDSEYVHKKGIAADTLEGYLFPDTYYFPKTADADLIIDTMLEEFKAVITPEFLSRAEALGFTLHEVVTLASIVEKETGVASERPVIASVFHNRLKLNMRLESDPTVIYGIKDFDGNITKRHLLTPTPYNTYRINGLPPGPIANPGRKALEAVLYPDDTSYLFFVSKNDNTHEFSTNINDHNRAVRKYQLNN